jgi:hypothetical protein
MHPTLASPESAVRKLLLRVFILMVALGSSISAYSVSPLAVYSNPLFESPVRAVPDELMMIAGSGLSSTNKVVYLKIDNTTLPLVHPSSVPSSNTATTGIAAIVASNDAPHALTVRLPAVMLADTSYAFWVRTSAVGAWSNGFKTNDARPMWITPDIAYRTVGVGTIGRQLKVVGRNLQPAPGSSTTVTLTGPTTYTLSADPVVPGTAIAHYVAKVTLPNPMLPGTYWNCPDLTHTKFSWQACQQEVCGGEEATSLRSGVQG